MKQYLLAFGIIALVIFTGCEFDDFCSEPTTPRIIISFHEESNPNEYQSLPIYVWADDKDSIYQKEIVDSIYIPLDTKNHISNYNFSYSNENDQVSIEYVTEDIYVSRSCGYKTNFSNLNIASNTNNWIKSIQIVNSTVTDETAAHIKILY